MTWRDPDRGKDKVREEEKISVDSSAPWERLRGKYVVGFVRDEGGNLEFHSMWDSQVEAHVEYKKLLKDPSIHCLVFASKIVGSMDKIVRYVMDKEGGQDPRLSGPAFMHDPFLYALGSPSARRKPPSNGNEGFLRKVTDYIKSLVEKEEKKCRVE